MTKIVLYNLNGAGDVYNAILRALEGQCVAVGWTGIAASLLHGGRTVHSCFKVPILIAENCTLAITPRSQEGEILKNVKLIVWDEISMPSRIVSDFVDRDAFKASKDTLSQPESRSGASEVEENVQR